MKKRLGNFAYAITVLAIIAVIITLVSVNIKKSQIQGLTTRKNMYGDVGWTVRVISAIDGSSSNINENTPKEIFPRRVATDDYSSVNYSNAGWCLNHGAYLIGGQNTLSSLNQNGAWGYKNTKQGYTTQIPDFLMYNLVRAYCTFSGNGNRTDSSAISADEINFFKKRLGIEGSLNEVFAAEQYVIWYYTNGSTLYQSNSIATTIVNKINANTSFDRSKEANIAVAKADETKNDFSNLTYGYFKITNENGLYIDVKVSVSTNYGQTYTTITDYTAYDENDSRISDLTTYNGKFYIQLPSSYANGVDASDLYVKVEEKHWGTTASYWTTANPNYSTTQDILFIDRTPSTSSATENARTETVSKTVKKVWNDNNDEHETRPESIKVQLLADGQNYGDEVTLNAANQWSYTWSSLPKQNNGTNIVYTVKEINVQGYTTATTTSGNTITLTNTPITDTETGTGNIGLYKYEDVNGNGRYDEGEPSIEGAEFKIATTKENAENGIFIENVVAVSGKDGTAEFKNLAFDSETLENAKYEEVDEETGTIHYKYDWSKVKTTYYIVETKAPEGYKEIEDVIEADAKKDYYKTSDISTLIKVGNQKKIYDLALRKFITEVKDGATGEKSKIILNIGDEEEISRVPKIDATDLASGKSTTAKYDHIKTPVLVHTTDIVTYTIQVYNEGTEDAYAAGIKDDIPEGLEFVRYTEGDGSINDIYGWKLVDENDNETTDISKAKYIVTDYLAKDSQEKNLIKAFDKDEMKEPDSRYVKVQFKVTEPTTSDRVITNSAQISKETDAEGKDVTDRDSTPNVWKNEDDEDIENLRVLYFDLALRKWVTQAIVTDENGETKVMETGHRAEDDPEEVVKVDLKKSKLDKVTVKFKYSIRITNQGEISGEATEIRDDIPEGLEYRTEDNPDWKLENGQIVTNKLAGTTLAPGQSAEVEIILTWINGKDNLGVKTNIAEINKDHNNYGTDDIDSTPGNRRPKEDDIDDAPVMLSIVTGSEMIKYVALVLGIATIIMIGAVVTKKVLKREDSF